MLLPGIFPGRLPDANPEKILQKECSRAGEDGLLRVYVSDGDGFVDVEGNRRDAVTVQVAREYTGGDGIPLEADQEVEEGRPVAHLYAFLVKHRTLYFFRKMERVVFPLFK